MAVVRIKQGDDIYTDVPCPGGICSLSAGEGVQLYAEEGLAAIRVKDALADLLYYYQNNYNAIIKQENIGEFEFEDEGKNGLYVSTINKVAPYLNAIEDIIISDFALLGGPTYRVDNIPGSVIEGEEVKSSILLQDIARPDVDCADYIEVLGYIERLQEVLDGIKNQIINIPETSQEGDVVIYGVHRQYQALQVLWNFLVQNLSLIVNLTYQEVAPTKPKGEHPESKIYVQVKIHNNTDSPYTIKQINLNYPGLGSGWEDITLEFDKVVKIIRTVDSVRISTMVTQGGTNLNTAKTWEVNPSGTIQPDEEISFLFGFTLLGVSTPVGSTSLPGRIPLAVDTEIPDLYASEKEGSSVFCKVHRKRYVYIPTEEFVVEEEDDD